MLVVSPLASGLFGAAVMESGACSAKTNVDAETFGTLFLNATGCGSAADIPGCLRSLSAASITTALPQQVLVAGNGGGYQPNVDGYVIPDAAVAILRSGGHNKVPLVVGANSDETARQVPAMTEQEYRNAVLALTGGLQALADAILGMYPISAYGNDPRKAYVALTTDAKFICTARQTLKAAAEGKSPGLYRYFYTHAFQNGGSALKAAGAFHGAELAFVFRHLNFSGYVPTQGEEALADAFTAYWTNMAATGNPGGAGMPGWDTWDPARDNYQQLDETIAEGEALRKTQCDFWNKLAP